MKLSPIRFLCMITLLAVPAAALAADPFEGTWKVVVTPDDDTRGAGEKESKDAISFKGGKFASQQFGKKGFEPVDYEADTRRGPIAKFTAKPESEKNGRAEWTGMVTSGELQGELTWTKADGGVMRYTFKGTKG